MTGLTELAVVYFALIGLIGVYVYRLFSRLADLDARMAAAEDVLSDDEIE
ncbi:hypothetical protein [Candidatus Thalassarchaeum betae]|nr:hypothetical protein [Candidatus Thalassoarchaea betae]